jgi:hypothetical protein
MGLIPRNPRNRFAIAIVLIALAMAIPTGASSLRKGIPPLSTATSGGLPGKVLWSYYETTEQLCVAGTPGCASGGHSGNGDNILTLINPNGGAVPPFLEQPVCAMVYVFDDDQEMGECCGCPISSAALKTFSVLKDLTGNWSLAGGTGSDHGSGALAVVAAAPNVPVVLTATDSNGQLCPNTQSAACNAGCDPTTFPGYSVTSVNLLGSMLHQQGVARGMYSSAETFGLTEVPLFDDAGGDVTNLNYLQTQCGALVGNSSGAGVCSCAQMPFPSATPSLTPTPTVISTATET